MYYGINTMGSYASQMTEEEMWMVDHYVMSLKDKLDGKEARPYDVVEVILEVVEEMHKTKSIVEKSTGQKKIIMLKRITATEH